MKRTVSTTLYLATLATTLVVFVVALFASNYLNRKKAEELQASEDKIAVDILSLETQVDLLTDTSCASYKTASLENELSRLNSRLKHLEQQLGDDNPEVFRLKRYYSLLEIKDYLVSKKMAARCNWTEIPILYFYSKTNCDLCTTQEIMLSAAVNAYPEVRLYSFDYTLDLPAVQTLIALHNIPEQPPVLDIQGKIYGPFGTFDEMKAVIEPLTSLAQSTTTAKNNLKSQ